MLTKVIITIISFNIIVMLGAFIKYQWDELSKPMEDFKDED